MRYLTAVFLAVLLLGCGSTGKDHSHRLSPVERHNQQAQREFDICTKQADEIARRQGADAGSAHLEQCTQTLANETQVAP